jgi:hypothetical protein
VSVYNPGSHRISCLMRRYCQLPLDIREYWPEGFSGRAQLCTCGVVVEAETMQPEHADDRRQLEEWLESHAPPQPGGTAH